MVSRREALRLMWGVCASLALSGCAPSMARVGDNDAATATPTAPDEGPSATGAQPAPDTGELEILLQRRVPGEAEAREAFNARFHEQHPDIVVNQQVPQADLSYLERLETLIVAGLAPDVIELLEWRVQSYALRAMLLNLAPYFEADARLSRDDLAPAALAGGSWRDGIYAFVIDFMPDPLSVYYNTDHRDALGLDHPDPDWTWDDLWAAAGALTIGGDGDAANRWGLAFDTSFATWLYWLWSNGGVVLNEDETVCTLTEPAAVEAIQYWADLMREDPVAAPPEVVEAHGGPVAALEAGVASMALASHSESPRLEEEALQAGLAWDAVLASRGNPGARTWYGRFRGWSVALESDMPAGAWLYMRDSVLGHTLGPSRLPSLRQLLPAFDNERNRELRYGPLIELALAPDVCRLPRYGFKWPSIEKLVQARLDRVFAGDATAADALGFACVAVGDELFDNCSHTYCSP